MVQKNSNVNLHTERILKHVAKCLKFVNLRNRWKVLVWQSCLTLCDPKVCSPPCSSVHGILQARILEWVAIPFSRWPFRPRDPTQVTCIAGRFFTVWAARIKGMHQLFLLISEIFWLRNPSMWNWKISESDVH